MAKFTYTALGPDGATRTGVEAAATAAAAHRALRDRGLQFTTVTAKKGILSLELTKGKVPRKDVMHFSRQLAVFLKSGIPILDALEVVTEETTSKLFPRVLREMTDSLRSGDTFAAAAAAHPEAFPPYYVGILRSAELTGNLDVVLDQLADYIERDTEARSKLTSALVYPGIVLGMSFATVAVLSVFVLPKFQVFFKSLRAKLPLPTRLLLGMTGVVTTWWPVMAGVAIALVAAGVVTYRSPGGRARLDALALKLPIAGDLLRSAILEKICRILGSMTRAGVPLPEALTVTAEATSNAVFRRGLATVRDEVIEGQGLAAPVARTGLFPGAAKQMFRVGEETGTLDDQLETAAIYYDRELGYKIKRFTALFEPAVIVIMGVVVGFVAVALVEAMYGIYRQVKA